MQKRVVGNINELNEDSRKTAFEESANTAVTNRGGGKANKTSFGRIKKFAVIIMLLIVSVFCAIGSADWIISQQEQLPGGSGSTFVYDKKTLQNYIALKGSDETEAAAKVAEAEEYASLQTETDSDDSAVADKFTVKKAAVSKKSAVSTYANGLESAIYGKSAIYNGKPIVAIKKTAGIDNAAADLPDDVLNGSLLTSYKPLTDGSVTEADLTEAYFAEGATSGLPQNAGTYAILVKIKGLEAYGYAVKIFTILPCPVTVDWSGVDFANGFTYDGAAHPVTAAAKIASSDNGNIERSEVNADLSVSIAKDGVSVSEVKTAGDYTLAATSGNDNYYISSGETTSFTVKKAPLSVTVNDKTITYGNAVPGFTLSYKGFVGGETASVLGGTAIFTHRYEQFSDVGTYTVTASGLTSENYKITYNDGTLTVIKYGLIIEWSDTPLTYSKTAQKPIATISNPITGLTAPAVTVTTYNESGVAADAINVGSYTAKASVPDDGNYYIASGETADFTVTAKEAAVTVNLTQTEILFGSEAPTATINYSGVISGDTLGAPAFDYGGYKKGSDVKTYTVTVKGLANGNYDIKTTPASFTVKPYGLNVTWSDLTFTYDKTAHKPTATVSNPIDGLTAPVIAVTTYNETGVAADAINAGSYTAKASVADTNYYITNETKSISFTIEKRTASASVNNKSITYGSEVPTYSASDLVIGNLIDGDEIMGEPTFNLSYDKGSPAGEYNVTVTFDENKINANYKLSGNVINGILTVNKAPLTVTADNITVTYGDNLPNFTASYGGFVNGENSAVLSGKPEFDCDYEKGTSPAGKTYIVKVIGGLYSKNYEITYLSGTLTVSKKSVTITIENKTITYGDDKPTPTSYSYTIKDTLTDEDISTDEFTAIKSEIDFACSYEKGYHAGDYKITATCNNDNYTLNVNTGTLKVNKAKLTLVANDNDIGITYGEAPSANGYYYKGFLLNDNEQSANITGTVKYSFDYNQYDNIYNKNGSKIIYYITPSVENFSSTNYACTEISNGILTVNKLPVKANVEKTYKDSSKDANGNYAGLHFDKDLFKDSFAPVNANITLPNEYKQTIHNDINDSSTIVAKNFTGTQDTSKAENGFFEYSFGDYIKAGSTYAITGLTLKNTSNYSLSGTVYLKYKTAKIGSTTYYTIEDAINFSESGDIVLASDSSSATSYIITSFSKIGYYGGNSFSCGKNIIVPHADGKTSSETKQENSNGNVGSVLIVPDGISLTINSATLDILAIVAMNNLTTCTTSSRGVVINNGTIKVTGTINNGDTPNIKAYGYLKGTGNVIVTDGATAEDLFHIFDFKGGKNTLGIYNGTKEYLPLNSYSLHNISCNIRVYAGCTYNALYEIYMGGSWFTGRIPVVGKSDASSALFKLSDGYLEKRAVPADNSTSNDLDTITGSNQLKGQKEDVKIYGKAVDGSITINVSLKVVFEIKATMQTGTNNPLPIPYMNIRVCKGGNLTLENSSYKFMPGSALIVDDGGSLTVGSNAKLVFYSVDECTEYEKPVTYKTKDGTVTTYPYIYMTNYCVDKVDAYFEINSNNTSLEGYISGKITTKKQNVKINIKNASATITVLNEFQSEGGTAGLSAKVSTRSVSMTATGNIITRRNNYGESEFTAGEYTSYKIGNEYYWASSSILKTVTLFSDGKQYGDTITEIIGTTITLPTELQKKHYTFGGWSDGSTVYNGSLIVSDSDVTLNAVWTPITYTINYEFWYNDQKLSDELTANIVNANPATFTCDKNITFERVSLKGYTFDKWYTDSEFGTSVSQTSDALKYIEDGSVTITLYGRFIEPAYTITYYVNNDEISAESLKNFVENLQFEYSSANTYISYLENGTAFSPAKIDINDGDTTKSKYFLGWYTDENCETPFSSLSDATKVNLYAKWGLKAQIVVVGNNGTKTIEGYYHYKEDSTFTFAEADISSIVASGYKFIGAVASSDYAITATNTDNPNNITVTGKATATVPEVAAGSSNTAPQIKVTADIRKILTVTITMEAYAEHKVALSTYTGYFSIDNIIINNNFYSMDNQSWIKSTETNIITNPIGKNNSTTNLTFFILDSNDSTITITINNINVHNWTNTSSKNFKAPNPPDTKTNCNIDYSYSGSGKAGISTYIIRNITNNATIAWSSSQKGTSA